MSRTYRKVPENNTGLRHPQTQSERRQLQTLKKDTQLHKLHISPINRLNRYIPTYYDDLTPSSMDQVDYNV
jgi:hypothetical protein